VSAFRPSVALVLGTFPPKPVVLAHASGAAARLVRMLDHLMRHCDCVSGLDERLPYLPKLPGVGAACGITFVDALTDRLRDLDHALIEGGPRCGECGHGVGGFATLSATGIGNIPDMEFSPLRNEPID
jgi:hypothetical protein